MPFEQGSIPRSCLSIVQETTQKGREQRKKVMGKWISLPNNISAALAVNICTGD